jgi:hypothetical protein
MDLDLAHISESAPEPKTVSADTRSLYQQKASRRRCAVRLTIPPRSGGLAAIGSARGRRSRAVTDHVRHCLGLAPETEPDHGAAWTVRLHRKQVRERQGVTYDQWRTWAVAEAAIWEAALLKNHPPDERAGPQGPGPLPSGLVVG